MLRPGLAKMNGMLSSFVVRNRVSEIRKVRGLTLVEVAKRANTSNQQIRHGNRGEKKLSDEWMDSLGTALSYHPLAFCEPLVAVMLLVARQLDHDDQVAGSGGHPAAIASFSVIILCLFAPLDVGPAFS